MLHQGFTTKVSLQPERKPNDLDLGCYHNLYDALFLNYCVLNWAQCGLCDLFYEKKLTVNFSSTRARGDLVTILETL